MRKLSLHYNQLEFKFHKYLAGAIADKLLIFTPRLTQVEKNTYESTLYLICDFHC